MVALRYLSTILEPRKVRTLGRHLKMNMICVCICSWQDPRDVTAKPVKPAIILICLRHTQFSKG